MPVVFSERLPGGPAFPARIPLSGSGAECSGMSLLDYFAGQALLGGLASLDGRMVQDFKMASRIAYDIAAAMLAERERRMKEK